MLNRKPDENALRFPPGESSKGICCLCTKAVCPFKVLRTPAIALGYWMKLLLVPSDRHSVLAAWIRLLAVNKIRSEVLLQFIILYL